MELISNKIRVYVGDVTESLAAEATKTDPYAQLITSENFRNLAPGTYYTSIGDLSSLREFGEICQQADEIIYCEPDIWSDGKIFPSEMKKWTEDYLSIFSCDSAKKVVGFSFQCNDFNTMTNLVDHRKSESNQIWIVGCSISHGQGVELEERYGHLLSKQLGLEASFLTRPSSSIVWAADQLLRSDVRSNDIIFWGITSPSRFTYWNELEKKVVPCSLSNWNLHKKYLGRFIKEQFLTSDIPVYQSVNSILQVVNFCKKINVQLVLATLMCGVERYLKDIPNFLPLAGLHGKNINDMFHDIGNDGLHPGRKSHEYYANNMMSKYNQLYQSK